MNCPNCNTVLSDNAKFCTHCGAMIKANPQANAGTSAPERQNTVVCIKCGAQIRPGAKFCTKCGAAQSVPAAQPPAQPASAQMTPPAEQPAFAQEAQPAPQQAPVQEIQPVGPQAPAQSPQPAEQPTPVQMTQPTWQPAPVQMTQPPAQPLSEPSAQLSEQQASVQMPSEQQVPAQQAPKKKKKSKLPLVMVIILLLILLLVGGYFVLDKVFDINLISMIMGGEDNDSEDEEDIEDPDDRENPGDTNATDGDSSDADGEEVKEIDPEVLKALADQLEAAKQASDGGDYTSALDGSKEVLNRFIALSEEYDLDENARKQIAEAFAIASKSAIAIGQNVESVAYGSAGYTQIHITVDPVLEIATVLKEKGYEVDSTGIEEYNEGIVPRMKEWFILAINEITKRDQWSRDEAWTYAEAAYSIQENGKTVLFDESDLDDPLRLRYVYCLAWIMRKRCENGVADGSMSNADAFNNLISVLEETDYNLLVLQDIITYGNASGQNVTGYRNAYNAIVDEIKNEQGLSIVNSGVNSGTSVDVRKFWYFNDLDGDNAYKVDINNGTTQVTRDWIRENIPSYIAR